MGVTWDEVEAFESALEAELPGFQVCYKDESRLQRLIGRLVKPFNRRYMSHYTTVMFGKVYFPSRTWRAGQGPDNIYLTLRHEAVHLRDMRTFPVIFQVSYLALLPTVVTMRALWEWRAYCETVRAYAEVYGKVDDHVLDFIADRFVSADYLFMFPFRRLVRRRLDAVRERALRT